MRLSVCGLSSLLECSLQEGTVFISPAPETLFHTRASYTVKPPSVEYGVPAE